MVRLSKLLADKNLLEDDNDFIVPGNRVLREFQSMLFRYFSANLAFWDVDVVKNLLQGMRNAARFKFETTPTDEDLVIRYHFIQRTNGTLRWLSRLTRARQTSRLLDYLLEDDKKTLLSREMNYSERQFGLRQLPGTNPLTIARKFAQEYELDPILVQKFEDELQAYTLKFDTSVQTL